MNPPQLPAFGDSTSTFFLAQNNRNVDQVTAQQYNI